jgi:hypothetical protein
MFKVHYNENHNNVLWIWVITKLPNSQQSSKGVPPSSLNLVLRWLLFYLFCSSIVIHTVIVTAGTFEPWWKRAIWRLKIRFNQYIDKKYFWHFCWFPYLDTFSLDENPSFIIVSAETEYISTRYWYRNINFIRDRIRRIFL